MNTILPVIAYHTGDLDITKKLLLWIDELHAQLKRRKHRTCLLVADAAVPRDEVNAVGIMAKAAFGAAKTIPVSPTSGHAPTQVFLSTAGWIAKCVKLPFFWLEPDCIPLVPDWLDKIEDAYEASPMTFMGALVRQNGQPELPSIHLTGCAVYPRDAFEIYDRIDSLKTQNVAWDIEAANAVVPRTEDTKLIRHFWGTREQPPVFVEARKEDSPPNHQLIEFATRDGAVVFHRCKDGSLIDLLRKRGPAPKGHAAKTQPQLPVSATA